MSDIVKLSEVEPQRVEILQACLGQNMKTGPAATKLGITVRQLQRLKRA